MSHVIFCEQEHGQSFHRLFSSFFEGVVVIMLVMLFFFSTESSN